MAFPKKVEPSTKEETEIVVFLSDVHAPFHDKAAVAAVVEYIAQHQPHRVVLNGDITDFYAMSRFDKDINRRETLGEEISQSNGIRSQIRRAVPNAVIDENEGNHEARLSAFINRNAEALREFMTLPTVASALEPSSLCDYEYYQINGHGDEGFLLRDNFWVKHGEFVRQDAGMSAKAQMLRAFVNGISGHTHRLGEFIYRSQTGQKYTWIEGGCLCDLDAPYMRGGVPNWVQGFAVGQFSTKTDSYKIETVEIEEGKILESIV